MNYIELFKKSVEKYPKRIAIVDRNGERSTSYEELDKLSSKMAGKLHSLGYAKGDFIVLNMGRNLEYIASYLGALKAGCIFAPVLPEYPQERIAYIISDCNAKCIITEQFFEDVDKYDSYCNPNKDAEAAYMVYTSGSTGTPKGILHSAADLYRGAERLFETVEDIDPLRVAGVSSLAFAVQIFESFSMLGMGATIFITPEEVRKSNVALADFVRDNEISVIWMSPQLLKLFNNTSKSLKKILSGGERVSNIYTDDYKLEVSYGMSEEFIVSRFIIDKAYENTPIGKALKGVELRILDNAGNELPQGQEGEICAVGYFDTCYFKNPEKTKEIFEKLNDGRTIIHSGDLGYKTENGDVVYVNRKDWMVKINGQRVETLEIESLLKVNSQLQDAAVHFFVDKNGQNYLVAYYIPKDIKDSNLALELRKYLEKKIPGYMIPRYFVELAELPKNINGKLDRKALKEPQTSDFRAEYVAPTSQFEEKICTAFTKILNCGKVGIKDDFFMLGGDSIKTIMLVSEIDLEGLTREMILLGRTPEGIEQQYNKRTNAIEHNDEIFDEYPLSGAQKGVYLECINNPESVMYNIPFYVALPNNVDIEKFEQTVKTVATSHKVFNTRFAVVSGEAKMFYKPADITVKHKKIESVVKACSEFVRPFDYENGPLYRFEIWNDGLNSYFAYDVHHLIFDGTSTSVFLNQIASSYCGKGIENEQLSLFDIAMHDAAVKDTDGYKDAEEFFAEKLNSVDTDSVLISDVIEEGSQSGSDKLVISTEELLDPSAVEAFVQKHGITENTLFMSAFAYTLAKFNGASDALFCTVNNGRHDARLNNSIGMFVRTLPIYFDIDESLKVGEFLLNSQNYFFNTMNHDCIDMDELVHKFGINTSIQFVYQAEMLTGVEFSGTRLNNTEIPLGQLAGDMQMMVHKLVSGYKAVLNYSTEKYSRDLIRSFANMYFKVVCDMLTAEKLSDISFVSSEATGIIDKFNDTKVLYNTEKTVVDLFKDMAQKHPEKECVVYEDHRYCYKEVDELSDRLARYLVKCGVKAETVTGILIPRNEYMVIASLAVLKAGGAYMPLDPSYPPERLNLMMHDANAIMLITTPDLNTIITSEYTGQRLMTFEIAGLDDSCLDLANVAPKPQDMFVVLYTSGTTGVPKGVVYEHANVMCLVAWIRSFFEYDVNTKRAVYASFGFDANVFDSYGVLAAGGSLHIISEDMRLDLVAIQKYFNENKITNCVMTTQVGRQFALMEGTTTLKELSVAGEALTPLNPVGPYKLYNLYGPSEGTVLVSQFLVDKKYKNNPIGKAIDNVKLYVVDEKQRLLPVGASGELVIAGPHVTRGYLNKPDKTAQSYTQNQFSNEPGYELLYHTGDIVRYMPDGNIQFVGRRDMQVKIRGFRVELTEVEEVIRRYDGIKDATVVAFDNNAGGKFMAAYVVADEPLNEKDIKTFIKSEKPPYMVPSVIMQLNRIPLNQNQKVDKRALPVPEYKMDDIVAPENELQQKIFDVIATAIGHSAFGIDTDIYEAGLTSIGAVKLNYDLAKAFDVTVKTSDISENSTVRKLESFLSRSEKKQSYDILEEYPISQTQNGIFVESISNTNSTVYNIPVLFKLSERVDIEKLKVAITTAVNAHPYIKMQLHMDDNGNIRALRNDSNEVLISSEVQEKLPEMRDLVKPFTMLDSNLYRFVTYQTSDGNYLFMDLHHIVSDGTSELILLSDIQAAIDGKPVEKENYTGFEFALDEERERKTQHYADAKKYYDSLLSGCDSDCLPAKNADATGSGSAELTKILSVDPKFVSEYCGKNALTDNAFFNAVFSILLSAFIHKEQVVYTTIYNGRSDSRLSNSVAMLVKTLPIIATVDGKQKALEFAQAIQKQLIKNMNNDIFSFAEIANEYDIKSDIIFAYQGSEFGLDAIDNDYMKMAAILSADAKAPISVELSISGGKYIAKFGYKTDIYNAEFIESFADSFDVAISNFINADTVGNVSILSENGRKVLDKSNDTDFAIENIPVYKFIERNADKAPNKTAIVSNGESDSFETFNNKINRIAHALLEFGLKNDDIVAIILDRSINVIAAELAVMKVGAAFLPMLPDYPDDRINYCIKDSASKLVITSNKIKSERPTLFDDSNSFVTKTIEDLLLNNDVSNPNIDVPMDALAYCIYTSGSTGNPKGVMIEERNLTNFVQSYNGEIMACEYKKVTGSGLGIASVSFDMSLTEIYSTLCRGITFVMATEEEIHNPMALAKLIIDNDVQILRCTPSFITNMIDIPEFYKAISNIKAILLAAEALPENVVDRLKQLSPEIRIINGYGPTETTIGCSAKIVDNSKYITIGLPSGNTKLFTIDRFGNILPPYAAGELIICGAGVGRGYINLPEKTKAAFYTLEGQPAYHSGDIVRLDKVGEYEFFGRIDNQVKVRGFRVELDEIEKTFCSYDGIKQSKVVIRNNGKEDYLAGFFTADHPVDLPLLRAHLKATLTYYMVPTAIMQLETMPLTPNGKIDKKALPEVSVTKKQRSGKRVAKKSTEEQLCEIFKDVLGLDEYYVDDDFFEMGGTSLSASKVTMLLMSKGIEIQYQDIFDNPTPETLAVLINSKGNIGKEVSDSKNDAYASEFDDVIKYNSLPYASEVTRKALGNIFLCGASGFLGIHILSELLQSEKGHIYCLVRKGKYQSPEDRLKKMMAYYFDDIDDELFDSRISIIDADVTNEDLADKIKDVTFDTIINCAAIVKHYSADNSLQNVNVYGVENLIEIAKNRNAKMIQISTTSIPGAHTEETYKQNVKMYENNHFIIDSMDNKYVLSKFDAECKMFEAIRSGLRGKVIRVGNLMGRFSDGEFQFNMTTNAFLNALRGFATLGMCPVGHSTDPMSFSPIDYTAKAVVVLAGTDDKFTVFHADSRYSFDEYMLIEAANRCGLKINRIADDDYYKEYYQKLGDEKLNSRLSALVTNDRPDIHLVETDNKFTNNILYRLGFAWPFVDDAYLDRTIESIKTLGFFDYE